MKASHGGKVTSANESGGRSTGRLIAAVILAIIGILFIIAGILYVAEPAKSLPSMLGQIAGSNGHHPLRAVASFVVGVILFVAAWFALRYTPKNHQAAESREGSPAGHR
jgi:amino acid permease